MRLCSIASGSSGNCIYVGSDHTHLLVDTGISKKRIEEGLKELEIKGEELDGILITHEHADHIQGLGVFSRKYGVYSYIKHFALYEGNAKMVSVWSNEHHSKISITNGHLWIDSISNIYVDQEAKECYRD